MKYEFDYKKGTFTLYELETGKDFSNQLVRQTKLVRGLPQF